MKFYRSSAFNGVGYVQGLGCPLENGSWGHTIVRNVSSQRYEARLGMNTLGWLYGKRCFVGRSYSSMIRLSGTYGMDGVVCYFVDEDGAFHVDELACI